MKNPDCTVVVTSCDKYADILPPFSALWKKFWPDCPFETVLITETIPTAAEGFDRVICTGKGKNWSEMLAEALKAVMTPYVLMLMNDYYLAERVDTEKILGLLAKCKTADALNLRMNPTPKTAVKNTAYSVSCQAGFWNREFLRDLASKTKSAWEFERYGSFMFDEGDPRPLLVTDKKEFPFLDVVHKGYWEPFGVRLLAENGIVYSGSRTSPPLKVRFVEAVKSLIFAVFPWNFILRVQNALNVGMKEKK